MNVAWLPAAEEASWSISLKIYLPRLGNTKPQLALRNKHQVKDQMDTTESHLMKEENLSVASPGEEDDHQSLLSSHDEDVTRNILVGVGARHPINKPCDGLYSHNDDPY